MKNRKVLIVCILLALLLSLATACKKSDEKPPQTPKTTTEAATPAPGETTTPESTPDAQTPKTPPATLTPPPPYDVARYGYLETLDPGGQEVLFWHPYTGAREELMLTLIDEFNRANEWGITVVGETWGSYDAVQQQLAAGMAAQTLPSLAVASPDHAAGYAAQDALVALEPYLESPRWGYSAEEWADFFPGALAADVLPHFGARYGWPHYRTLDVLYYNADWLAELGYTGPPETWEQFEEMACKAVKKSFSKAVGRAKGLGYVYVADAPHFADFVISRGGSMLKADGTAYTFNAQAGADALTFWQSLATQGCAAPAAEPYDDQAAFGAGRALFTLSPVTWLPYYRQAVDEGAQFAWGVSTLPAGEGRPRVHISGASQVIFARAPEEQLATWLFLRWLSEPAQQATWAGATGFFPTRRSASGLMMPYMQENPLYLAAFDFMTLDSGGEAAVGGYDECRGVIAGLLANVLGGADVALELTAAVNQCNDALWAAAPADFVRAAAKPTPAPQPLPPVVYDPALYGDVERLDPSGQAITCWHPYTGAVDALLQELATEFTAANEWGITVSAASQGGDADLQEAINASLAEQRWPSLAWARPGDMAAYVGQEMLIALEPYIHSRRWGYTQDALADFFPAALDTNTPAQFEAHYGWALSKSMDVLYYNADWLAEMGFDGPPQTWEAFSIMARRAMTQPFTGAAQGDRAGFVYTADMTHFTALVLGHGGDILKPDGSGYAFGGTEGVLALTLWHTLTVQGCATETAALNGDRAAFGEGRALFTVGSTADLGRYEEAVAGGAQFAWGVSPLPHSMPKPRVNVSGASQAVFVSAPEEQLAAWLFLRWLSEPAQQARWAAATGEFPIRQSARPAMGDYLKQHPVYAQAFELLALDYSSAAQAPGYEPCRAAVEAMLPKVLGGASPRNQLLPVVRACDGYLAKAKP